jgi:hypothetical protein
MKWLCQFGTKERVTTLKKFIKDFSGEPSFPTHVDPNSFKQLLKTQNKEKQARLQLFFFLHNWFIFYNGASKQKPRDVVPPFWSSLWSNTIDLRVDTDWKQTHDSVLVLPPQV